MKVTQGEGNEARHSQLTHHTQRQRLIVNPAERNECVKLELQGAWEPLCRHSPLSIGEGESSQGSIFYGDEMDGGWDEKNTSRIAIR